LGEKGAQSWKWELAVMKLSRMEHLRSRVGVQDSLDL
jgi:hypothetical protein